MGFAVHVAVVIVRHGLADGYLGQQVVDGPHAALVADLGDEILAGQDSLAGHAGRIFVGAVVGLYGLGRGNGELERRDGGQLGQEIVDDGF